MSNLENNTEALQEILDTVNALPEAGGSSTDGNLFDISAPVFAAASTTNILSYKPKVDGTALLSGGVLGNTAGAFVVVQVPQNANLLLRAINAGESGMVELRAIGTVANDIFVHSETVLLSNENYGPGAIIEKTVIMPDGYTLFGFAFYGATQYCMRLEDITVALVTDAEAALAIVMGDAE